MQAIHESAAETAKKVRKALKEAFPGVKFSVTSSTYSMGSSVSIDWTDGPSRQVVQDVADKFKSATFDGMTDSQSLHGYLFEGQRFIGASYIQVHRHKSGV
ncbi:MAG: hypothetical protein J7639_24800 [Paenibacillaceae bacterium]|nr:hypothetical protein [Paenibacillaceae bacterium]